MKIHLFLLNFIMIFLFEINKAHADLKIFEKSVNQSLREIKLNEISGSEGFHENNEKYKIYGFKILLDQILPGGLKNNKNTVISKSDGVDVVFSQSENYLIIGSRKSTIEMKTDQGQIKKYIFEWNPVEQTTVYHNCGKAAPKFFLENNISKKQAIKSDLLTMQELTQETGAIVDSTDNSNKMDVEGELIEKKIPFLLGISCRLVNKNLWVTVSTLSTVDWVESSIFESAGKAERWRDYQVPAWSANGGTIANFKFKIDDIYYNIQYIAPKSNQAKKQQDILKQQKQLSKQFENNLKLSIVNLALEADAVSAMDSKYGLGYDFLSPKMNDHFRFGGFFNTSLEISKKDDALSLMELLLHADYVHSLNEQLDLSAGISYQYVDFQQKSTAARMQNSQIGTILGAQYLITAHNRISIQGYKTTFSSDVVKSNLGLIFEYKYKIEDFYWLGAFYKMQTFDVSNESGAGRKFKENQLGISLSF